MKRYDELDSLRGLAAISVVGAHILNSFIPTMTTKMVEYGPLRLFVAGTEGVVLFFILSGFVLYLPFSGGQKAHYGSFLVRRIFRIYMPYIVATSVVLIASLFIYQGEVASLSIWFNDRWDNPLNADILLGHLFLIGVYNDAELNPVIWSLVHEMRISLIFPFIAYFVYKQNWKVILGFSVGTALISVLLYSIFDWIPSNILSTLYYLHMFIFGALLAKYKDVLINMFTNFSVKTKLFGLLLAFVFYLYAKPSFILNATIFPGLKDLHRSLIDNFFVTIAVGIFIMMALSSSKISKILLNKSVRYMGQISYSLYLYHCIALLSILHLLDGIFPLGVNFVIAILLAVVMASISYKYIEVPFNNLGKSIVSRNRHSDKVVTQKEHTVR